MGEVTLIFGGIALLFGLLFMALRLLDRRDGRRAWPTPKEVRPNVRGIRGGKP